MGTLYYQQGSELRLYVHTPGDFRILASLQESWHQSLQKDHFDFKYQLPLPLILVKDGRLILRTTISKLATAIGRINLI